MNRGEFEGARNVAGEDSMVLDKKFEQIQKMMHLIRFANQRRAEISCCYCSCYALLVLFLFVGNDWKYFFNFVRRTMDCNSVTSCFCVGEISSKIKNLIGKMFKSYKLKKFEWKKFFLW